MSLLRLSQWTYSTGAGGGAGIDIVMATGGTIILDDPQKQEQKFHYGGVGIGFGLAFKIPRIKLPKFTVPELKIPKIGGRSASGAGSTLDFPSYGHVYMTSSFDGKELTRPDIQGAVVYIDGSVSALYGWAGDVMLLGIDPAKLVLGLSNSALMWLAEEAIYRAPALLVMYGQTVGVQAGASIGLLVGYLH
ncbi:hypothetical protein [Paraburkholderia phosphatilytica]|uniref:hypothetical protein n=1 Tax=Paraburkholderia phosphatilytica TaxID=2282883 RepID=UPI000E4CCC5B|nr:hypothetical protein [Paraburkholderia phosphatilytica]